MTEQKLAEQLSVALRPVEPRAEFVQDLGARLLQQSQSVLRVTPALAARPLPLLWLAAGAGAVLSVVGVAVMLRQRHGGRFPTPQAHPAQ